MTSIRRHLYLGLQLALFGVALAVAIATSREADWRAWSLALVLAVLVFVSERMSLIVRGQTISGSFVAMALAMTLLGPAPALAIGLFADISSLFDSRLTVVDRANNVATCSVFLVTGGLLTRLIVGNVHEVTNAHARGMFFAIAVFGIFICTNALNFGLIAINKKVTRGRGLRTQVRWMFVPMLPSQIAAAALAAILAVAYVRFGFGILLGVVVVLVVFQFLAAALIRSEERGEQLRARSVRLAQMQLGMLATLMETLTMRDARTARHAAAVAKLARQLSREAGCSEAEQEQAHTAGLLHDVGKFAWPDRVLHATWLTEDDRNLVRRHPLDGASIVGRLDGYATVSDIILCHHERMDGTGYPSGLIGNEIPFLSRVLAICEVYDTLTAPDSYRQTSSQLNPVDLLRDAAGHQLDPELVETFLAMLERQALQADEPAQETRFADELDFERRAHALAEPTKAFAA